MSYNKLSPIQSFLQHVPFSIRTCVVFFALSCNSNTCTEKVDGGFPSDQRSGNRIQVKLTEQALEKISNDTSLLSDVGLGQDINLSADCSSNLEICCDGGNPQPICGPIVIDTDTQEGDLPRLELATNLASNTIEVTLRARIQTANAIRVSSFGIGCDLSIDTTRGSVDDITFVVGLSPSVDPISRNTRFDVAGTDIQNLQSDDLDLDGNFLCDTILDPLLGLLRGTISDQIESQVADALNGGLCMSCPSGELSECNEFSDACTDGVCMSGPSCTQELGVSGAINGATLLSSIQGQIHLLSVLGESVDLQPNGLLFSFLTGSLPLEENTLCGPEAVALPVTFENPIPALNGNVDPSNNEPFDIAIGIHQNYFNQFLTSGYNAGFFCLDLGVETSDQLVSSSIAPLIFPSLNNLLADQNTPIRLGLRPQLAPNVTLGPEASSENTLLFEMKELDIDFIVPIAGQDIVVLTTRFDLSLPIRLTADDNGNVSLEITDVSEVTSNFSIVSKHGLLESDEDLETRIPLLFQVALPGLLGNLGSFALPGFGGFQIKIKPDGINVLENNQFLALFANLEPSDGSQPASGCSTTPHDGPWGVCLLFLLLCLWLKRHRIRALLFLTIFASGCSSCGDEDETSCDGACLPGELSLNDVGFYNDIKTDGERTLVLAYEKELGDLMAADVVDEDSALDWTFVDGVPDERPVFDPSTLRNGIEAAGPLRGEALSLNMHEGLGLVSYLGQEPLSLHFAFEETPGQWQSHPVLDNVDGHSHFTSVGIDDQGRIVIAYNQVIKMSGAESFEGRLNIARSNDANPGGSDDWTHDTVARVEVPCFDDTCESPWPSGVVSSPIGTGLFLQLHGEDSDFVTFYDSITQTWNLHRFVNGGWTELASVDESGSHSNTVFDSSSTTFYVAHQKARRLESFSFTPGIGLGPVQQVDDGLRQGSAKPNLVGQGSFIFLQSGALNLFYQDGSAANLRLAKRNDANEWTSEVFMESTRDTDLVGFRTHMTGQGGTKWVSTYRLDPLEEQKGKLVLKILAE